MMIGLVGKARCGKSSVGRVLVREFGYLVYPMAGAIRKAILSGLPFVKAEFLHDKKEEVIPELGVTGRKLLQTMGHDWGRSHNPDIWIEALDYELELMKVDHRKVVIDDVRYDNEVDYIKSKGGHIIGVDRPVLNDRGEEKWRDHASESGIDITKVDDWVANISPFELDLEFAVQNLMERLNDPVSV